MTIFSFALIAFIIKIVNAQKSTGKIFAKLLALCISLELMISVGYFIKLGGLEIGYSEFLVVIIAILALYLMSSSQRINKRQMNFGLMLLATCVISLYLQIMIPYDGSVVSFEAQWDLMYFHGAYVGPIEITFTQIKELIHLVCFILIAFVARSYDQDSVTGIMRDVFNYCKYFVWFGMVEFLSINIFHLQAKLYSLEAFVLGDSFFNNSGVISFGITNRLKGLKSEPSMYAYALFIFMILALVLYLSEKKKTYLLYAVMSLILQIASFALTIVVCLAYFILFIFIYQYEKADRSQKKLLVRVACAIIVLALVAVTYFYFNDSSIHLLHRIHMTLQNFDKLNDVWNGDYHDQDASTRIRLISIKGTFEYFLHRPLFGLSLGSTYAHSPFMTILSSIGLFGTVLWYKFVFYTPNKMSGAYTVIKLGWCAMLVFAGAGLFPFYGVQNLILYYALTNIDKRRLFDAKDKSVRSISSPVSHYGI